MSYNLDAMKKTLQESSHGSTFWKPPQGNTKIRILPGTVGNCDPGTFYRKIQTHNFKFSDGFRAYSARTNGDWSPIEACRILFKEHGMQEQAKSLNLRTQFALNIVVQGEENVKTWKCSGKIVEKLIDILEDEDWGDFTDTKRGFCILISRKGEGIQTRYDAAASNTKGTIPEGWEGMAADLALEEGLPMEDDDIIPILVDKYEDVYADLESELMTLKKSHIKPKKEEKDA